ncbi:MAG: hypothetical protein NVSMB2_26440 [Chloroflexota bacterium]
MLVLLTLSGACAQPQGVRVPKVEPTQTSVQGWLPAAVTKSSGCVSEGGRPDPACTPGAIDPRVTPDTVGATICTRNYAATVRPPNSVTDAIKRERMKAYGLEGQRLADYELDHLISLEIGGAPADVANLWPQPRTGTGSSQQKDAVENFLHREVCRGAMTLRDAQRMIAEDWVAVYIARTLAPST